MFKQSLIIFAAVMLGHNMHAKVPTSLKEAQETAKKVQKAAYNHRGKLSTAAALSAVAAIMKHQTNLSMKSDYPALIEYRTNHRLDGWIINTIAAPSDWICRQASEHYIVAGTLVVLSTVAVGYNLLTTDNSETEETTA